MTVVRRDLRQVMTTKERGETLNLSVKDAVELAIREHDAKERERWPNVSRIPSKVLVRFGDTVVARFPKMWNEKFYVNWNGWMVLTNPCRIEGSIIFEAHQSNITPPW